MVIKALNINNIMVDIPQTALDEFQSQIRGELVLPNSNTFDQSRTIWNAMIDKHPAFIVRCTSTADVVKAVEFANKHKLILSVRSAGHNIAGRALQNDVMLIDLSHMRNVTVDPERKTVTVRPGATLGDVDHETSIFGLALPMGINSTTGIAGLTLGGGFGWLSRLCGMTADSLLSAELITVKGQRLVCDEKQNPDLFWAIKGGGGNFGIVTSFTFKLHKVPKNVIAGPVVFDINQAKSVLMKYHQLCQQCDPELTVWGVIRHAPPFPFLDAALHGKPVLIIVFVYFGDSSNHKMIEKQILSLGNAVGQGFQVMPFLNFQQIFDPLLTPGARNYWKTHNFIDITDDLINELIKYGNQLPSSQSEIFIAQMGGATNTILPDATAYPHRDINFIMNVHVRWDNPSDDKSCIDSARRFYQTTLPFATGGAYVNFVSEGDDNLNNSYGPNIKRLESIKLKYDPDNVLRANLNIQPNA